MRGAVGRAAPMAHRDTPRRARRARSARAAGRHGARRPPARRRPPSSCGEATGRPAHACSHDGDRARLRRASGARDDAAPQERTSAGAHRASRRPPRSSAARAPACGCSGGRQAPRPAPSAAGARRGPRPGCAQLLHGTTLQLRRPLPVLPARLGSECHVGQHGRSQRRLPSRLNKKRAAVCLSEAGGGGAERLSRCSALLRLWHPQARPAQVPVTSQERPSVPRLRAPVCANAPALLVGAGISDNCQPTTSANPTCVRSTALTRCDTAPGRTPLGAAAQQWTSPRAPSHGIPAGAQAGAVCRDQRRRATGWGRQRSTAPPGGRPEKGDSRAVGLCTSHTALDGTPQAALQAVLRVLSSSLRRRGRKTRWTFLL